MAVPTHHEMMLPLLEYLYDGTPKHGTEAIAAIDAYFQLSDDDRAEMLPSGKKTRLVDRVHWAATYLRQAGLMSSATSAGRGYWTITDEGRRVVEERPAIIDRSYLMQYPSFVEFITPRSSPGDQSESRQEVQDQTPEERMASAHKELEQQLAADLLERIMLQSPLFFEQLVVDLLRAMGYGGSLGDGQRIGQSGDGGIDGVIKEDKLGLDSIYIQAKRWTGNSVGRPEIQAFVGSLVGAGASKGVFITTSSFSQQAIDYAQLRNQYRIVLIDGRQLTALMIEHNVGVNTQRSYAIKRVDSDYFQDV